MATEPMKVGIALGIAATCFTAALITAIREPGPLWPTLDFGEGRVTVDRSCANARLTLSPIPGDPTSSMLKIQDPRGRRWRVLWSAAPTPVIVRAPDLVHAATDVGPSGSTSVQARPEGATTWCLLSLDL